MIKRGIQDEVKEESYRSSSGSEGNQMTDVRFDLTPTTNNRSCDDEEFQLPPDQLSDEFFDNKGTSRKEYENEYFKRICSEVIEDFMYLGSDFVAADPETFSTYGITHVINCAADYSANYFEKAGVIYKSYHLKDHVRENIECLFYDAIEFIDEAKRKGGKIYVHCVQGVSRSATICLAYLIFQRQLT
mmetsp:Transcript_23034/g.22395  ORF Transcript_23034/g.22395 Transcript_23034/m.22395 type:complete len:188 (+) Transcript_23034:946-1509(+)